METSDRFDGNRKDVLLTARSLKALRWIAEQEAVSRDHISQLLGTHSIKKTNEPGILSAGATDQIIKQWLLLGLVGRQRFITMTPPWIWLTTSGMRALGLNFRASPPRLGALTHLHAINFVRLLSERQAPGVEWTSQRLLQAEQPKRTPGLDLPHFPDARALYQNKHYAIEVELTAKSQARLLRILHELIQTYDVVHYYVSAETNQAVNQALSHFAEDEQKKVRIALLEHYGYSIRRG
jgi:hypothetical protein